MPKYMLTIILGSISAILVMITIIKKDKKMLYQSLVVWLQF